MMSDVLTNLNGSVWQTAKQPLRRYLGGEFVMEASKERKLCLWKFYPLFEAKEVPCLTLRRCMLLLLSDRTAYVTGKPNLHNKRCEVTIYGPLADDAIYRTSDKKGRMRAVYLLSANIIHDREIGLSAEEKKLLVATVRKKGKGLGMKEFCEALNLARCQ